MMPKRYPLRSMICAPKGYTLIMCDLSQAETWVVAYLANEISMKYSLLNSDIHTDTAGAIFLYGREDICSPYHKWVKNGDDFVCSVCSVLVIKIMRFLGKKNNHANSYGMQANRQAEVINQESDQPPYVTVTVSECEGYQKLWHSYYTSIKPWWFRIQESLHSCNRKLVTPYGRERTFYGHLDNELYKQAYAHIPQSTVADHFNGYIHPELRIPGGIKGIRDNITKPSNGSIRLLNQSHDSCIVECPTPLVSEIAARMVKELKRPLVINDEEFTIPVDCEVGVVWGEMERYKVAA